MSTFAFNNLLITTDLPTTMPSFAIANTTLRLNAIKKPIKKNKLQKGDQLNIVLVLEFK
jgi:hypothetical protein